MEFQGGHAGHQITWNVSALICQEVTDVRLDGPYGPEIELSPNIVTSDYASDDFFWCETCCDYVYPDDFLGTDDQWQLV
jgi:hypothetical protein